jgi:hypothetical protein
MGFVSLIKDKIAVKSSKLYTKLHWYVLAEDWNGCRRRIAKTNGAEARSVNECESFSMPMQNIFL